MPFWYYEKSELRETPSVKDGLPLDAERRYRKEGARFIMDCGTQMGLGHNTTATGVVYFHRFYMFHSFKNFPRYVTACCCLFLAGKVEETPKKSRDIISTAKALLSEKHFLSFGEDPKEEVMTLERILLQTIKFDLQVEHPHTFVLKYAKCFKGDQQKLQKMVQMAWNFVNDSLSTVVCLQWEPEIIAVSLIYLASKLSKFNLVDWVGKQPQHNNWWDMFVADVSMEIIEDICHQVLDLYQNQKEIMGHPDSPPQKPPSRSDSPLLNVHNNMIDAINVKVPQTSFLTVPIPQPLPPNSAVSSNGNKEISNLQPIRTVGGALNAKSALLAPPESITSNSILPSTYDAHMYEPPPPPPSLVSNHLMSNIVPSQVPLQLTMPYILPQSAPSGWPNYGAGPPQQIPHVNAGKTLASGGGYYTNPNQVSYGRNQQPNQHQRF